MAIRMIDDHHAVNVMKINGNPMATQKSELSADGKVFKTETISTARDGQNTIEYWDKK